MEVDRRLYAVSMLVDAFEEGQLVRNAEYQRGAAWSRVQQAGFIDSIFRGYPVPAIFLREVKSKKGLSGQITSKLEIVDGQQRLLALREYRDDQFPLQSVSADSKLKLPKSVIEKPAPWAGNGWGDLDGGLQERLSEAKITVFVIAADADEDEVRDLFIRLQSGTALTRQQVRDAWPGAIGPFIERIAGKMKRHPSRELFGMIDRRGQGLDFDDERDPYVNDRQYCAQLLQVFISRERNAHAYPTVSASALDALYHEQTDFDPKGNIAQRFLESLERTENVLRLVINQTTGRKKVKKLEVLAIFMFFQDMLRAENVKISDSTLSERIRSTEVAGQPGGKTTSASTIEKYYEWWREAVAKGIGIRQDRRRLFSETQKQEIWDRNAGVCGVCKKTVERGQDEYDHYPIPHRDGGLTETDNGRLVHRDCHPRGRPRLPT